MTGHESSSGVLTTLTGINRNVGAAGGDLASRIVVLILLIILTVLAIPVVNVSFAVLKISSLVSAQLGAVFLMTGLLFSRKTYFAGIVLIPAPLFIMWLAGLGLPWFAVAVGVLFVAQGLLNILTRRCGINTILHINSCHK